MIAREKTILYVDDDPDDRELLWEAMQAVAPELKVTFAENGLKALELLNEKKKTDALPCLIVLDLNMPYLNGTKTFEHIKVDSRLNTIPLVVLSAGESPVEKGIFSRAGIPYFSKPTELSGLEDIARSICCNC